MANADPTARDGPFFREGLREEDVATVYLRRDGRRAAPPCDGCRIPLLPGEASRCRHCAAGLTNRHDPE